MSHERVVELTSAGWIHNPRGLFARVGEINRERINQGKRPVGLELYPGHPPMGLPGPGRVTLDNILHWQKEYGPAPVERIHLPFHYNLSREVIYFLETAFLRPRTDWGGKVREAAIAYVTTNIRSGHATHFAEELGAGLNAHGHTMETAEEKHEVAKVVGNTRYVWVENDSRFPKGQSAEASDPSRAMQISERNGFQGIIIGIDHAFQYGDNPEDYFCQMGNKLKNQLRAVHLSASSGNHGLIREDDKRFWDFIDFIKKWDCDESVRFCLDLNPMQMRRLSPEQQLENLRMVINKLEN